METVSSALTICISPAQWFLGIILVFFYAFFLVHFIEKYTDSPKTANPVWFYICCFILSIFTDGLGQSSFIGGLWAALWGAVKIAIVGQGVYALLDAFGLIVKIESIMKKKISS